MPLGKTGNDMEEAMREIERYLYDKSGYMFLNSHGEWVRYEDHQAEIKRLTAEQNHKLEKATITQMTWLDGTSLDPVAQLRADVARLISERDEAQAEVERITQERDRERLIETLTEIQPMPWECEERLTPERDAAQAELEATRAEVTRLTAERDAAQAEAERLQTLLTVERGELATLRDRLWPVTVERNEAQVEVKRLTEESEQRRVANHRIMTERGAALNEVERLRAEVERLRANGQGMLDTSRPTDEDIWREAFMRQLFDHDIEKLMGAADLALALYRKRWPR